MELPFAESWKIKMVEPIRKSTRQDASKDKRGALQCISTESRTSIHRPYYRLRYGCHE